MVHISFVYYLKNGTHITLHKLCRALLSHTIQVELLFLWYMSMYATLSYKLDPAS